MTLDPTLGDSDYQLARVYARLGESEKSKQMFAQFNKLNQQEASNDSRAADKARDDDMRKETE